ncbi:MAG: hypothetical protein AB1540_00080 [Bdellovibrionota bacterium]
MAYQLEFAEERVLRDECARQIGRHKGSAVELRRAYDALNELAVISQSVVSQAYNEYRQIYLEAFQIYNRGDLQNAEVLARAVKHLCRAAWFDAKIKQLESHSEDLPHLPGLNESPLSGIEQGIFEVESRLSRLKLTGLSDRFGGRARKHLQCIRMLADRNSLLADTFMKAAYEYCLATEMLHKIEFKVAAA